MCRNITILRGLEPAAIPAEIEAGARQYVRKISGIREPSANTVEVFEAAVQKIAAATTELLTELPPRKQPPTTVPPDATSRRAPVIPVADRVVMLSGPVRGIGRSVAERLNEDGYRLSLGGRDLDAVAAMPAEWGAGPDRVTTHHFDAVDADSARRWVDETAAAHGGIDVVINNAGMLAQFSLDDYDEQALDSMWEVNVKAPTLLTHLTLPHLRASGHGRVINISSLSGKRVKGGFSPGYAMSKHALMALTHATRQLGWDDGVRATAICPSFVGTEMIAGVDTGEEPVIDPADIAELVATALRLPNSASVAEIAVNCRREDLF